jgi:hypothetical protein
VLDKNTSHAIEDVSTRAIASKVGGRTGFGDLPRHAPARAETWQCPLSFVLYMLLPSHKGRALP